MKLLLQRTGNWSDDAESCFHDTSERSKDYRTNALPKPNQKVFLASLNRHFNNVVCVDHVFL